MSRSHRRLLLLIGATISVVACTSGTSPTGVGGGDGGGGGTGAGGGDVAQCQELAANFATKCAGDDTRPCLWNAYKSLCSTGQTQLLIDSMNCLDATTCRTFSDPNEGEACLAKVHAAGESSAAKNYIGSQCAACGESNCGTVKGTEEIYPYVTDADIGALMSCAGSSCVTSFPMACESNADIALFMACLSTD